MGVGGTVRTVSVEFSAKIASYVTNVRMAGQVTKAFAGELQTLSETSKSKFNDVTKYGLIAGAALTGMFLAVVAAGMQFDKQMSEVNAVVDKTGLNAKQAAAQYDQLRAAAIKAGRDTAFTSTDAARAEAELAKAGVSAADILGGGLTGALSLAAAGSLDLGKAATYSAQAMNEFGLTGAAVPHIADVLAAAANKSATDVEGMALSLNQSAIVAHQYGLTLEDTAGALALFAQNGLVGSDAGTSFKVMLQALNPTSEKTQALMKDLGISFYDTQGNFVGITKVAGILSSKLHGLTEEQRNSALAQIFGSDATRAANILYQQGSVGLQTWIDKTNDSGAAARTAAEKMNNLSGDVEQLKGSLEALTITSSGGANQGLRVLTQTATGFVNAVTDLPAPLTETLTVMTGIAGVTLLLGTGFVKLNSIWSDLTETLTKMGPAGEKAAGWLGKVGGVLGKAGLWGAGALLAYEGISALTNYIDDRAKPTARNVDALSDAMVRLVNTGAVTGELERTFGASLTGITADIQAMTKAEDELARIQNANYRKDTNSRIANRYSGVAAQNARQGESQAVEDFSASDAALAQLVSNGQSLAARNSFDLFTQQALAAGKSMDWINSKFPTYLKASADVALANASTATNMIHVKTATSEMTIGLDEALTSGSKLKDVLDALSGANEDYAKSNIAAEQALADLNKQLKDNDKNHVKGRKSLDDTTQAGRDNLKMLLATIDADKQQFQTSFAKKAQTEGQTQALKDATEEYDAYIGRLRTTFINEGFNAQQVDALIKLYGQIPPVASTDVKIGNYNEVIDKIKGIIYEYDKIGDKTVNVKIHYKPSGPGGAGSTASAQRWGGYYTHAATGLLNAGVFSPQSPARYAFAEPQTGGEGFVPRYGNYARSTRIIDEEARWYGGRFVPGGGYGGGGAGGGSHTSSTAFNIYPQKANFSVADLQALQAAHDAHMRVGRRQ